MQRSATEASTVVIEPFKSSVVNIGFATLPAVCPPIDGTCQIAIVNTTNKPIKIFAGSSIALVKSVKLKSNHTRIAESAPRLSFESKLRKVLHELEIDALPD